MFPLQHEWVLWEKLGDKSAKQWVDGLRQVGRFNTVEGFWM